MTPFKHKTSAQRAAKRILGHAKFEIVPADNNTWTFIDTSVTDASKEKLKTRIEASVNKPIPVVWAYFDKHFTKRPRATLIKELIAQGQNGNMTKTQACRYAKWARGEYVRPATCPAPVAA